ncbi:MAG TPA: TadE/TadG family type IV pilus assembly protein [Allosphingosinicella sp.]|nr:TadE/TadG family type IV pilus assembly protein [Allosphingosinicella sp.]
MRSFLKRIAKDRRGLGAVEFALICPALFAGIIGIAQLGILFYANAGLSQAVGEGARLATIYPRPTDAQIIQKMTDQRFGLQTANITGPTLTNGTSDSANYVDVTMSYQVPLNFVFFTISPVTLTQTRRAYTYKTS